jgi:hypothetical protein
MLDDPGKTSKEIENICILDDPENIHVQYWCDREQRGYAAEIMNERYMRGSVTR